jgi:hypothetical protein
MPTTCCWSLLKRNSQWMHCHTFCCWMPIWLTMYLQMY